MTRWAKGEGSGSNQGMRNMHATTNHHPMYTSGGLDAVAQTQGVSGFFPLEESSKSVLSCLVSFECTFRESY